MVAQSSSVVRRYVEETGLPFNILVDESRDVMKAYGVWHRLGLDAWNIARPALFLIDSREDPLLVRRRHAGGVPVAEEIARRADAPQSAGVRARSRDKQGTQTHVAPKQRASAGSSYLLRQAVSGNVPA